jgi:hypothetical protein
MGGGPFGSRQLDTFVCFKHTAEQWESVSVPIEPP